MTPADWLHGRWIHPRRVRVLAARAAALVPPGAELLDVGCGDGLIAREITRHRPDIRVRGIDVLVRSASVIPVSEFDGRRIPFASRSVDTITLFDVLHHADDPQMLLAEAARVARAQVLIKDHICESTFDGALLRFMDDVGNERHGVARPHRYWSLQQWTDATQTLGLTWEVRDIGGLGLYPWPASLLFGRSLHLLACLKVANSHG
ncbi:MAG: class I SAM-dependent methyltransferase [Vicinamibacterales bacterium]